MRINDCYRALAASVINHALLDREKAQKKLKKDPECTAAIYMLDETNAFFNSTWFEELLEFSGAEGGADKIREMITNEC